MKTLLATLALIATASIAGDIVVDIGTITVPDAAVQDVLSWLDTQPDLYTTTNAVTIVEGEEVVTPVKVKVHETPKQKFSRLMNEQAKSHIRREIRKHRERQKEIEAFEAVNEAPDPIEE